MLPLDSPKWAELTHHFGSAVDTPHVIKELIDCLDAPQRDTERYKQAVAALDSEIDNMVHQSNLCDAAEAAIPYLFDLVPRLELKDQILSLIHI